MLGLPNHVREKTYLRLIYKAHTKGLEIVGPSYIAKEFGVSKVTAYEALLKLAKMGFGDYIPKKGFRLNGKGIEAAKKLTKKHRLIECFFAELDVDSEKACEEATKIECFVSDWLIEALERRYYNKKFCPCGYLIHG